MPSLLQLDEAVRAFREEHPTDEMIVVVDATFAHRIPDDERPLFEEAAAHNELVYPPAGAIGRGDAFLLRIADKTGAIVLSNDSFQEFHGEFEWLFEKGRLVGGTPVPGVGWIFVPRTPVRGPKSREAVKEAKRSRARVGSKDASQPMPVPKAPPPRAQKVEPVSLAIAEATEEAVGPSPNGDEKGRKRRRRRRGGAERELPTLNEPLTFIQFIADHKLGARVEGTVESFSSHGAFVNVGEARCYVPLSAMANPPPRSAREVMHRGEEREFVVQALDAPRRGIELALPGFEQLAGQPTAETVEAEITEPPKALRRGRDRRRGRGLDAATGAVGGAATAAGSGEVDGVKPGELVAAGGAGRNAGGGLDSVGGVEGSPQPEGGRADRPFVADAGGDGGAAAEALAPEPVDDGERPVDVEVPPPAAATTTVSRKSAPAKAAGAGKAPAKKSGSKATAGTAGRAGAAGEVAVPAKKAGSKAPAKAAGAGKAPAKKSGSKATAGTAGRAGAAGEVAVPAKKSGSKATAGRAGRAGAAGEVAVPAKKAGSKATAGRAGRAGAAGEVAVPAKKAGSKATAAKKAAEAKTASAAAKTARASASKAPAKEATATKAPASKAAGTRAASTTKAGPRKATATRTATKKAAGRRAAGAPTPGAEPDS